MDVSAGASGRAFLMLFSKYQRQYELHWMRLYPPNRPPTQTTLCWQCLSLEPEQPTIYQKRLSVSTDLHPLAQCLLNHCFLIVQFVGFFCFVLHISISPRSLGALTIASFFKCDKPIKHSYEKGWWGYCAQTVIQHSQLNLIESFPRRSKLTLSSSVAQTERYWMSCLTV